MEKIAVIGLSCLFPGAHNPEQFFQHLLNGDDLTSLATAADLGVDPQLVYDPIKGKADKVYYLRGGYIRDFEFDPTGYRVAPERLARLDELFQWSLHVAKMALHDSGYLSEETLRTRCGVVLGNLAFPTKSSYRLLAPLYQQAIEPALQHLLESPTFQFRTARAEEDIPLHNAFVAGYPTALIAQALGLGGMHFALDAACASALYAVKLACQYLQTHRADLMLAGGVSCADALFLTTGFSNFQAYPEDDISRPLDRTSGGLTTGEGAGMLVLKRHADAVRDGDRIYATIRGIGISNDGRGKHLLTPNSKGQLLALERAYADGVDPATIDYIECHATGTPVGDITELNTLETFFEAHGVQPLIGSVKSNLGHLLTAAGMAGLIKVILSLVQEEIPATIHVREPLHSQGNAITGAQIVRTRQPWPQQDRPPRAAVSAFGFGGNNAHVIVEREPHSPEAPTLSQADPAAPASLAIVGMDAFFGSSRGLDALDYTVYAGAQDFTDLPLARWKGIEEHPSLLHRHGSLDAAPAGAYIDAFEIDALRSRIPPNDAEQLNPQQLLMLKVADNALRDAGLEMGQHVAVIIAMGNELSLHRFLARYHLAWQMREALSNAQITLPPDTLTELEALAKESVHHPIDTNEYVSSIGSVMANRISSLWDFNGPSFTLSAEENSTFKALDVAQMLLTAGEVDAVLVGAVDLAGGVENVLLRNQIAAVNGAVNAAAHTGTKSLSFERDSNGWLVGEGAGAVVLKRYTDAASAGDRIYAAIDAISIVQTSDAEAEDDSRAAAMQRACQQAFSAADVQPTQIGYIEAWGSGIPWEDQAEFAGLLRAYRTDARLHCAVGSIKANIGHTFAAAGMASLIKTALCLYHRYLPATPGWTAPKSLDDWQNSSFFVATDSVPWFLQNGATQRWAAVNGLGMDGACAHIILSREDHYDERPNSYLKQRSLRLFPIIGADPSALLERLEQLHAAVQSGTALSAVAHRFFQESQQQPNAAYAAAIVGRDAQDVQQEIELARRGIPQAYDQQAEWKTPRGSYFTAKPLGPRGQVAFVYPGAFTSYIGMERDMLHMFPQIRTQSAQLTADISFGLEEYLYPRSVQRLTMAEIEPLEARLINDASAMLKAGTIAAFEYTLILRDYFRLHPAAAFGYSLGEFSMQFAQGVWTSVDQACAALDASPLFSERLSGPKNTVRDYFGLDPVSEPAPAHDSGDLWSTYVLLAAPAAVHEALRQEDRVYLTHINAPGEVVIAGDKQGCRRVIETLGCDSFRAPFTDVLHCEVMRSEYDAFVELFDLPVQRVPDLTLYSAAAYAPLAIDRAVIGPSIAQALCKPLDFPQLIGRVYEDGARIFIELGPGGTCTRWIEQTLQDREHVAMSINRRGLDNHSSLLKVLAQLFSQRVPLELSPLYEQSEQPTANAIVKTVTLGERRMADRLLTEANKRKFRPRVTPLSAETPAVAEPAAAEPTAKESAAKESATEADPIPAAVEMHSPASLPPSAVQQLHEHLARVGQAHTTFLQARRATLQQVGELIQLQQTVAQRMVEQGAAMPTAQPAAVPEQAAARPDPPVRKPSKPPGVIYDEADVLEFATGRIAPVFGAEYALIDTYKRRVRLPGPPYLFMSRVTKLEATRGQFGPCSIQTEYDIPHDAWYTVAGQVPSTVVIEASHANMFLASYLGIDFENQGHRVYRALDGHVTFQGALPQAGDTLRCDVQIDSFARNGDTRIFFYTYNCSVNSSGNHSGGERPLLTMKGIAGFFSDEELEKSKGVAADQALHAKRAGTIQKKEFAPLLQCGKSSFNEDDLAALTQGNRAACFGAAYAQHGRNPALRLSAPQFRMLDRVTSVDPAGGTWGLGLVQAEKDLQRDAWYFQCHFKDDLCIPGTVVGEGCVQLLQFYMLHLGMQVHTANARFQPVPDTKLMAQSRGQITPQSGTLTYRLQARDVGLAPHPYVIANVDVLFAGKVIARCNNIGLQLVEDK